LSIQSRIPTANLPLLTKERLEEDLNIRFKKYNYQVTFHPETLGNQTSADQFQVLLDAIDQQEDSFFIFTKANADTDGRIINQMIDSFVFKNTDKAATFHSLGSLRFLSLVKVCTAIVGNSSSGIIEAPSLKTATINIGERQKGRIQAGSVVNVVNSIIDINRGFAVVKELLLTNSLSSIINPYNNGGASEKILRELVIFLKQEVKHKVFFNK